MKRLQLTLILLFAAWFLAGNLYGATGLNPTNVRVTEIVPKKLNIYKSYVGHLKPQNRVVVRSETSGTVEQINVDDGVPVEKGQVLVHISTRELELRKSIARTNFEQARSDYEVEKNLYFDTDASSQSGSENQHVSLKQMKLRVDLARAEYEHARNEYEIQKRLFEKNMTSATSYDTYRTTMEIKQITWQQAMLDYEQALVKDRVRLENYLNAVRINQANLKLAELELEKSKVKAPFTGIVKKKIVDMGGFIQNGSDLLELMDISKVLVRINIPEKEFRYAGVGKKVSVKLDAVPGEAFTGTIKTLGMEADVKCRCFPADVEIDNQDKKLLPGMMARVEMLAVSKSNQIIVPRHAVIERLNGSVVFVARNGVAQRVPVQTGEMIEENVQIVDGLSFGDKLIVVGQDLLAHKEPVNVVNSNKRIVRKY